MSFLSSEQDSVPLIAANEQRRLEMLPLRRLHFLENHKLSLMELVIDKQHTCQAFHSNDRRQACNYRLE